MRLNFSGKYFKVVSYGVRKDDHRVDFDDLVAKAREHKPKLIIAGASAYPRTLDFAKFGEIASDAGAPADGGHGAHLRAGGGQAAPGPGAARGVRHQHHAQDAPRAAQRVRACASRSGPTRSTRRCSRASRAGR
jgi:glycine hydroxymethyltransferase